MEDLEMDGGAQDSPQEWNDNMALAGGNLTSALGAGAQPAPQEAGAAPQPRQTTTANIDRVLRAATDRRTQANEARVFDRDGDVDMQARGDAWRTMSPDRKVDSQGRPTTDGSGITLGEWRSQMQSELDGLIALKSARPSSNTVRRGIRSINKLAKKLGLPVIEETGKGQRWRKQDRRNAATEINALRDKIAAALRV
jgi:enamine deaminase RidA (YjgF/YER057c/UK114 family)